MSPELVVGATPLHVYLLRTIACQFVQVNRSKKKKKKKWSSHHTSQVTGREKQVCDDM